MYKITELCQITGGRLAKQADVSVRGSISIDTRTLQPDDIFIAIKGDNFDGHDFIQEAVRKGAACIMLSEQRPVSECAARYEGVAVIMVKDTVAALGSIASHHRKKHRIPVIAVSGSNGKTTTKDMLACVLSKSFNVLKNEGTRNNHIGVPTTLLKLNSEHDVAVLELGTNHFGEIAYLSGLCEPTIGVITNIGPSHLEYFGDLGGVLREKYTLIDSMPKPSIAVLNGDDKLLRQKAADDSLNRFIVTFGTKMASDFKASGIKQDAMNLSFRVNAANQSKTGKGPAAKISLKTLGQHNIYNALASLAVGRILGLDYPEMSMNLENFEFPRGRLRLTQYQQIKFIDDTYNSNPLSLCQALASLAKVQTKGRKIFIMGDMMELGNSYRHFHTQAGKDAALVCDIFVAVGEFSRLAAEAAKKAGFDTKNIFTCSSSQDARNILLELISPGKEDIVLVKGSRSMKMERIFKEENTAEIFK